MVLITKEFDTYSISYRNTAHKSLFSSQLYTVNSAVIYCYYSEKHLGNLVFRDSEWLPLNSINSNTQIITIYYQLRMFDDIIDMLRNEKPLRIYFDNSDLSGGIKTKYLEPVGEEES